MTTHAGLQVDLARVQGIARRAAGRQWATDILRLIATHAAAEGDEVLRRVAADAIKQINPPHRRPDAPNPGA